MSYCLKKMPATDFSNSVIFYKRVFGSNLESRTAFDGTVPYCVSCSAAFVGESTDEDCVNYFSVVGQANTSATVANAHDGIAKPCIVNLRNISLRISGKGTNFVRIAVCDPTNFPANDSTQVYLYEDVIYTLSGSDTEIINIPDITGIVVNGTTEAPLNVCVWMESAGGNIRYMGFHAIATVDD